MDQNSVNILIGVMVAVLGGLLANTALLWYKTGKVEVRIAGFSEMLFTIHSAIARLDGRIDALFTKGCDKKEPPSDGTSEMKG